MSEECPDCGATFADPAELVQHVSTVHHGGDASASMAMNPFATTPGYTCAMCGAVFDSPAALARHDLEPHRENRRWGRARIRSNPGVT